MTATFTGTAAGCHGKARTWLWHPLDLINPLLFHQSKERTNEKLPLRIKRREPWSADGMEREERKRSGRGGETCQTWKERGTDGGWWRGGSEGARKKSRGGWGREMETHDVKKALSASSRRSSVPAHLASPGPFGPLSVQAVIRRYSAYIVTVGLPSELGDSLIPVQCIHICTCVGSKTS
jgi:hypothetical protein